MRAGKAPPQKTASAVTKTLFRGAHEKELLWLCLHGEDPWKYSDTEARLRSWKRAAEACSAFTTITVETSEGIHEVDVDLLDGKVNC